ncbi:hypothetical protein DL98DRAFT_534219 [Cadophora sp. DSE1049]|nr:hypothetical protein DL98DRAFT_534219 [Cadophora sp. DSE1049]
MQMLPDVLSGLAVGHGPVVFKWPGNQQPPSHFWEIMRRFIDVPFLKLEPLGLTLITLSRYGDVSNLRDKVYALLGIIGSSTREKLVVDVKKPVADVYLDFSACLINISQFPAKLLHEAGTSNIAIVGLPSWCFDLSFKHCQTRLGSGALSSSEDSEIVRRISGTEHSTCEPRFEASVREKILQFSGWEVDEVKEVFEAPDLEESLLGIRILGPEFARDLWHWEESCLHISKEVYDTPDSIPDAHWRTLTMTCNSNDRSHQYKAWKQELEFSWRALPEDSFQDPAPRQPSTCARSPEKSATGKHVLSTAQSAFHHGVVSSC